jgi:predicted amidophosphoribosyltransferase
MINLKSEGSMGNPPQFMSQIVAEKIKKDINQLPFKHFFSSDVFLVPVPKSSLIQTNTLWVPEKIANALSKQGLGDCYPCLKRIKPVQKAAFAAPANRPKAIDHYNSIECKPLVHRPKEIVLIDDVITRGCTLLGCASRLNKVFPDIPIKGFAVLRTMSNPIDLNEITDPCVGKITLSQGETLRKP